MPLSGIGQFNCWIFGFHCRQQEDSWGPTNCCFTNRQMIRGQWKKIAQMMVCIHDMWHPCVGGGDGKINDRFWSETVSSIQILLWEWQDIYMESNKPLLTQLALNYICLIPMTSFIKGHAMVPLPAAHSAGGQPQASMTQACQHVSIVTDSLLRWVDFVKMKNQRFPHLRLNILRIFINPVLGNRFFTI